MFLFNYHQTTEIIFGRKRIKEAGEIAARYGKKVLLVTTPPANEVLKSLFDRTMKILMDENLEVEHFSGVLPNPTVECISEGANMAKSFGADVVVGLGGGSSIDAAKAISVEATHKGKSWDYLFFKEPQPEKDKLLPVIAITTTSGTGSHLTQVSVVTNTEERNKSALFNNILFPEVAIVDPELMLTVPEFVTACTGFDVFCHSFESILNPGGGVYIDLLAWEAVQIVIDTLPNLLNDLNNIDLREKLAWADTLAGLSIANAGVTLPHGMGMAIGGMYPHVAHGEALAIVYPACMDYTKESAITEFSRLASVFDPSYAELLSRVAADKAVEEIKTFLEKLGLNKRLSDISMPENEIEKLAKQCMVLPDYKANPRVTTEEDMLQLVKDSYR
ncbi:MAG: iron-containing alcohol dehydrogenase [Deltaproteobacteria bacterium]|nr:iron-containing alcohol dehydrogenase [Deltaproteobacteria bacterium]